jgi:hypothetical protein
MKKITNMFHGVGLMITKPKDVRLKEKKDVEGKN